jgi:hypothetical protein
MPDGSGGAEAGVGFNPPTRPEQAPGAEFTEKDGRSPTPGYPQVEVTV